MSRLHEHVRVVYSILRRNSSASMMRNVSASVTDDMGISFVPNRTIVVMARCHWLRASMVVVIALCENEEEEKIIELRLTATDYADGSMCKSWHEIIISQLGGLVKAEGTFPRAGD